MSSADAQKSEVHAATADADSSPTAAGDRAATKQATGHGNAPADPNPRNPVGPEVTVVRDDTDSGGPLVIQSDDPDLNPPRVPSDPFPTNRTPEIDPPVKP